MVAEIFIVSLGLLPLGAAVVALVLLYNEPDDHS